MPSTPTSSPTLSKLLNLLPNPSTHPQILSTLSTNASLATSSDQNGYTLLHAAASYSYPALLRTLVGTYHADPNVADNDGDTPLFYAETEEAARCLIEELDADIGVQNEEGVGVLENARDNAAEGESGWDGVVRYLEERAARTHTENGALNGDGGEEVQVPPPLPSNVRVNIDSVPEDELNALGEADPELRARIETLAVRSDFDQESGQKGLKALVEDAVGGLAIDDAGGGRGSKRRAG